MNNIVIKERELLDDICTIRGSVNEIIIPKLLNLFNRVTIRLNKLTGYNNEKISIFNRKKINEMRKLHREIQEEILNKIYRNFYILEKRNPMYEPYAYEFETLMVSLCRAKSVHDMNKLYAGYISKYCSSNLYFLEFEFEYIRFFTKKLYNITSYKKK